MNPTDDSKFDNPRIEISSDGSATLFVPALNEHYHSVHGARNESMHVFIEAGLRIMPHTPIKILEIGMGTGLNVLLTASNSDGRHIEYHTIEKYPLREEIFTKLNYSQSDDEAILLNRIHTSAWNEKVELSPCFTILKLKSSVTDAAIETGYNLVYFDAFAPEKQPEMWQSEIFSKIYNAMAPQGVLVTYCAKGDVRRMLKSIGFEVERIPGPPYKRHMTRAIKKL
jgi:tRNA U34 5-methylaminomethyl-2-thiouridine-forming methyltransferase MnmC